MASAVPAEKEGYLWSTIRPILSWALACPPEVPKSTFSQLFASEEPKEEIKDQLSIWQIVGVDAMTVGVTLLLAGIIYLFIYYVIKFGYGLVRIYQDREIESNFNSPCTTPPRALSPPKTTTMPRMTMNEPRPCMYTRVTMPSRIYPKLEDVQKPISSTSNCSTAKTYYSKEGRARVSKSLSDASAHTALSISPSRGLEDLSRKAAGLEPVVFMDDSMDFEYEDSFDEEDDSSDYEDDVMLDSMDSEFGYEESEDDVTDEESDYIEEVDVIADDVIEDDVIDEEHDGMQGDFMPTADITIFAGPDENNRLVGTHGRVLLTATKAVDFVWTQPDDTVAITGSFFDFSLSLPLSLIGDRLAVRLNLPPGEFDYEFLLN